MIPDNEYSAVIDRPSAINILENLSPHANKITKQAAIRFTPDAIKAETSDVDTGAKATSELPGTYQGPPVTAAYNVEYLIQILQAIDTEKAVLKVQDATTALMVHPYTENATEAAKSKYLLMPLRLND